ncbi:hypothetical protein [Paraferrimonas sedimenticola]|uniref:Uncharacterized protein n=1 Tax=Paraferrimonas sedimenticola TaxID=375674 RepID=A0AA37RX85_9GAMM|nr:hypothetical protein [Paraferrimonas sedimenticola]GLP97005.1 hypothetical protein GCM10007895_23110 [Paraferrimonas sedimenticola]
MTALSNLISVNVRYQRSTRIDSDLDQEGKFFNGLVFHGTAEHCLNTLIDNYSQASRRAFTVTGPYGSGKSTIALLLAGLLSSQEKVSSTAKRIVGKNFWERFNSALPVGRGWFVVKCVCDFEDPISAIWRAVAEDAKREHIVLSDISTPNSTKELLKAIKLLNSLVEKSGYSGTLILLDEMGKSLDFLNTKNFDLQLFQEIAECVERLPFPTMIVGFLHQAFSEYAQGQTQKVRDSWAKVQGRYTDLLFNVSEDETVTLLGNSIVKSEAYKAQNSVVKSVLDCCERVALTSNLKIAEKLFHCLPLHPLSALLLGPISKRRFSQNERSTFSFLSSSESKGFQDFLKHTSSEEQHLYLLSDLFDYLSSNLDHLIMSSPDARVWAEAKDAVERAELRFGYSAVRLVKTIALLNVFGRRSGLYPSKSLLIHSFDKPIEEQDLDLELKALVDAKILIFRGHVNSYAVFEGSDVDIDEELELFRNKHLDSEGWKAYLKEHHEQVIAKRHYHETGSLRWVARIIETDIFDERTFNKSYSLNSSQFSAFVLLTKGCARKHSISNTGLVFGSCEVLLEELIHCINELLGLKFISEQNANVQHDRIARREIETRSGVLKLELDKLVERMFEEASWFCRGELFSAASLSRLASDLASEKYKHSPILRNELINRVKPSGTAIAARNKLMHRMVGSYKCSDKDNTTYLKYATKDRLGIDKTPPEYSMYQTCLKQMGLHNKLDGGSDFGFQVPPKGSPLSYAWKSALNLVVSQKERVVTLKEIKNLWGSAPFGISAGVTPIWLLAFAISNVDCLAFYDKDVTGEFVFITEPDEEFAVKVARSPEQVAVRYFESNPELSIYFNALDRLIESDSQENNPLTVAQNYVRFLSMLSPYTKHTVTLTDNAKSFRALASRASDPNKFLLEDLPDIFEVEAREQVVEEVREIVGELRRTHKQLLQRFLKEVEDSLGSLDEQQIENAQKVENYTADSSLKTFARRLTEWKKSNELEWVSSIISFLSGKAERNWTDSSVEKANSELVKYAERFRQASYFANRTSFDSSKFEGKNHSIVNQQIGNLLSKYTEEEQTVILQKQFDLIWGVKNDS